MKSNLYAVLIFVVFFNSEIIQAQWCFENCPTLKNLNAIALTNSGTLWVVGDEGTILRKYNNNWQLLPAIINVNLNSIDFIDENNGWAVGDNGTIIHYNGSNWESVTSPVKNDLFSVKFKDNNNGSASGSNGTIILYSDGKWTNVKTNQVGNFNAISYADRDLWTAGGLECVNFPMIRIQSRRNDEVILTEEINTFYTINGLHFTSSIKGWAVGSPSTILQFNGTTWEKPLVDQPFSSLNCISFSDETIGICAGYDGTVMTYKNGMWTKETTETNETLNGTVISDINFYAVGSNGTIISKKIYDDAIINSARTIENEDAPEVKSTYSNGESNRNIELLPNPCDQRIMAKLRSEEHGIIKITIINLYGQVLIQKQLNKTDETIDVLIETIDLESGMYILNAEIEAKTIISSFIVKH